MGSQPAATKDAALSTGGKEITVVGNTVAEKRATQTVMLNAPAGSTFHVSAWAKANAAPSYNSKSTNPDWDERFFGLYIVLVYTDNTAESQHIPANTDTTEWQFGHRNGDAEAGEYGEDDLLHPRGGGLFQ